MKGTLKSFLASLLNFMSRAADSSDSNVWFRRSFLGINWIQNLHCVAIFPLCKESICQPQTVWVRLNLDTNSGVTTENFWKAAMPKSEHINILWCSNKKEKLLIWNLTPNPNQTLPCADAGAVKDKAASKDECVRDGGSGRVYHRAKRWKVVAHTTICALLKLWSTPHYEHRDSVHMVRARSLWLEQDFYNIQTYIGWNSAYFVQHN